MELVEVNHTYAKNLKILREVYGIKQTYFARAINRTTRSIVAYEDGTGNPSLECIINQCVLFEVTPDQLLGIGPLPERILEKYEAMQADKHIRRK